MTDIYFHVVNFVAALAAKRDAENAHILEEDLASSDASGLSETDAAFERAAAAPIGAASGSPGIRQDLVTVLRDLFEDDEAWVAAVNMAHRERHPQSRVSARPSPPCWAAADAGRCRRRECR